MGTILSQFCHPEVRGKWKGQEKEAGHVLYLVKCLMVVKDQAHVPYEPCHCVYVCSQPFLHQVQPHGFLKGLTLI